MLNIAVAALHLLHLLKGHVDIAQIQDVVAGVISEYVFVTSIAQLF